MWLHRVKQDYGNKLDITWKHFCLEEINSRGDQDRHVWEKEDISQARSLVAQTAAEAAKKQGNDLFEKLHLAILTARHGGKGRINLNDEAAILQLATTCGLDSIRLREDMNDPSVIKAISLDHIEAVTQHGVFGTPTFIFEDGEAAYLKSFIPPDGDAVSFFEHFTAIISGRPYFGELKRPQPPWPRGIFG